MIGRIVIEDIRPQVDCGQFTARAVAGETVPVSATIFRDGHNEVVAAAVRLTGPGDRRGQIDVVLDPLLDPTVPESDRASLVVNVFRAVLAARLVPLLDAEPDAERLTIQP